MTATLPKPRAPFDTRQAIFYALPHAAVMILAPYCLERRVPMGLGVAALALPMAIIVALCVRAPAARWLAGLPLLWIVVFAVENGAVDLVRLGRAALIAGCVLALVATIALALRRAWVGAAVALLTLLPFALLEFMALVGSAISG